MHGLHIESIFNEDTNIILYASKFYQTAKMDKSKQKEYIVDKRTRSYSEDENTILHLIH
jgi:hypothetical protein